MGMLQDNLCFTTDDKICVSFKRKPDRSVLDELKKNGMRWETDRKIWSVSYSNQKHKIIKDIVLKCNADIKGYHVWVPYDEYVLPVSIFEGESICKANGYNVSSLEGLNSKDRRTVLRNLISQGKATQNQLIYYMKTRIDKVGNNRSYVFAVEKYKEDLKYLESAEFTDYCLDIYRKKNSE